MIIIEIYFPHLLYISNTQLYAHIHTHTQTHKRIMN